MEGPLEQACRNRRGMEAACAFTQSPHVWQGGGRLMVGKEVVKWGRKGEEEREAGRDVLTTRCQAPLFVCSLLFD